MENLSAIVKDLERGKISANSAEEQILRLFGNSESTPMYGDKVKCSMQEDYKEFWLGTYIAKHPTKDLHIVLLRARPELKIVEELDAFTFCQKQEFPSSQNQ